MFKIRRDKIRPKIRRYIRVTSALLNEPTSSDLRRNLRLLCEQHASIDVPQVPNVSS